MGIYIEYATTVSMIVQRAYRYRLYPNQEQRIALEKQFGCCRFVYNRFLRERIDYYAEHKEDEKKGLTYHDTALALTALKAQPDYLWLQEVNAQALQQALRDLDTAYSNFFNKRAQFPKFKRKGDKQSFRVPQSFILGGDRLKIPKVSPLKLILPRPLGGKAKSVTLSKTPTGKYFASILCEVSMPEPVFSGDEKALDLGLKSFVVDSQGHKVDNPQPLRKREKRLKRLQRQVSRRVKGSKGREKARKQVARQHEKVANARSDFHHKLSRQYVRENQALHLEDLNVKGMAQNHCLAKSISDAGWSEFVRQLEYKGAWYGCRVFKVDRFFPSSKRCSACGFIHQGLRLRDREWACQACGVVHDRDLNAALNILIFSTAGTAGIDAGGETGVTRSLKPEAVAFTRR